LKKPTLLIFIRKKFTAGLILFFILLSPVLLSRTIGVISMVITNPLKGKKIVIDPGHGGIDGGSNCRDFLEKEVNLAVARSLQQELTRHGARVFLTREKDVSLDRLNSQSSSRQRRDLYARVAIIEKVQPDIFLSIHINANRRKPSTTGSIIFYNRRIPNSEPLAAAIQTHLNRVTEKNGLKKHSPKPAGYFLLKNTSYPGAIVELGFITNPRDKELLKQDRYQGQLIQGIVEGLQEYFSAGDRKNIAGKPGNSVESSHSGDAAIKLFFPGKNTDRLGWEPLETKQVAGFPNSTGEMVATVVKALIEGPENKDLLAVFDPRTQIRDLKLKDGIVKVDFSKEFLNIPAESHTEYLALSSIVETITQFRGVRGVKILVEGALVDTLAGHMDLSNVLTPQNPKAVIALVIDDLAGGEAGRRELMSIKRPLALAIMPGRELSRDIAREAHQKGYQVLLHIPMEPERGKPEWLGPGAITADMSMREVRETLLHDLDDVPYVTGINNHMGSKVTKREDIMREVLTVAKEKNLLVLDSRTTEDTVIPKIAGELGIPVLKRDVFLDDINSVAHVKKQIRKLAGEAVGKGSAIGIGHVGITGKNTVRGITEMIPWLEEQGIELVFIAELFKQQ